MQNIQMPILNDLHIIYNIIIFFVILFIVCIMIKIGRLLECRYWISCAENDTLVERKDTFYRVREL
jgi:hypothetical protein